MSARRLSSIVAGRRGAALVAALTMLVVVLVTVSALLQQVRVQQQAARTHWNKLQAQWLAESALSRAAIRLQKDPAYAGETWEVQPGESSNEDNPAGLGTIHIEVRKAADIAAVDIEVTADYPRDSQYRARAVLSRRIPIPASSN